MHMLFRRNFQRHGFQTNIYACGVDLFNKPSGILGAGEFFLKIVKAKAIVDTLVQNAAQFTVPLYNADGAAACLPGSIRSRQPRRTAADHNKIILHFPLPPFYGANLGATESWLLARSLRTLPLRVKKMAENGLALAKFFESHPKVEKVYYPGLESSPSKALADKQFEGNGYGGMLCVNFKGGQKEIDKLISNLQLVRFVPTLAGVGTTLTYPPRASHRDLSPDELAAIGITMGQIRLSSGLEDTDDLLNDFDQALAKM